MPHDTPESARDMIARAAALLVEAFDALSRETARAQASTARDRNQLRPAFELAKERGFSPAAVARWCKEHQTELGAEQAGGRGRWRLSPAALDAFLTRPGARRRAPRTRRSRRHLSVVDAA